MKNKIGLIKSKTDSKLSETAKNEEEKAQIKRERKITMDNLKSLSTTQVSFDFTSNGSIRENRILDSLPKSSHNFRIFFFQFLDLKSQKPNDVELRKIAEVLH